MSLPVQIIVGRGNQGDPVAGQSSVVIPALQNKQIYLEKAGIGTVPYADYTWNASTYTLTLASGVFVDEDVFTLHTTAFVPAYDTAGLTNGFNYGKVMSAFQGRIGWQQPTIAGAPVIDEDNLSATSMRYFDDFHAAVRANRLYDVVDDKDISDSAFNALLQSMDQTVIMRCLNAVFNRPQLIEHSLLYERTSNLRNIIIPNQGNFCGYRIKVAEGNYAVQLNAISLFFDSVKTFNIYLYNDLKKAPLKSIEVTTEANSQVEVSLGWVLNYISSNKGGMFYIGYFQNDLGSTQGVDEQLNQWQPSKVYGAWPFQSPQIGDLDFNRINPSVVFRSYGLNLEVSAFRDYTQTIIQNAHLFDEARGLMMAVNVIENIKNAIRSNGDQRINQENMKDLEYDLNLAFPSEDRPFMAGLKAQLINQFKRINDNFFPKAEAMSVPIGSMGSNLRWQYDTFDIRKLPPREQNY